MAGSGLGAEAGRAYAGHFVPSDSPDMRYGNGLMHRDDEGRAYLTHTGGMVAFSSAFHLDVEGGVGAFASSSISHAAEYRPRSLTLYAVKALSAAQAGRPIPAPPGFSAPIPRAEAAALAGRYVSGGRAFEVRAAGEGLALVAGGREAPLEIADEDVLKTGHPDFAAWPLRIERTSARAVSAGWGPETFVREGASASVPPSDPVLARLAGRYCSDNAWWAWPTSSSAVAGCGSAVRRR